jgi:hypothetical protein
LDKRAATRHRTDPAGERAMRDWKSGDSDPAQMLQLNILLTVLYGRLDLLLEW